MNKELGKGKKIYILHGWAYSLEKWDPFVLCLQNAGFDCELLKIPGLTGPIDRPWILEDYVGWLLKVLPENKKVILLGHSNGGRIAAKFASLYPEKVEQLILIDSAGISDTRFLHQVKRLTFGVAAKVGKSVFRSDAARKLLYKAAREHDYKNANPVMRDTMKNLIRVDLSEDFRTITVPTTIIWGRQDQTTPFYQGEKIHQLIHHSKFFAVDDARHSPMFTHTKQVCGILKDEV